MRTDGCLEILGVTLGKVLDSIFEFGIVFGNSVWKSLGTAVGALAWEGGVTSMGDIEKFPMMGP